LDDHIIEHLLLIGFSEDVALDGMFAHEPVDVHIASLTDSMSPIRALPVHGRIPIEIVEDDGICASQVDPETAGAGRQDETQNTIVVVKPLGEDLALLDFCSSVETQVPVAVNVQELLQDVQDLGHLREDQGAVASCLELPEEFVQSLQLSAVVLEKALVWERDR
jgi:hypothetical protein